MPFRIMKRLEPGDWFTANFGGERETFYVYKSSSTAVYAIMKGRLHDDNGIKFFYRDDRFGLYDEFYAAKYIGKGKKRWWRKFMPFKELICPYTFPK